MVYFFCMMDTRALAQSRGGDRLIGPERGWFTGVLFTFGSSGHESHRFVEWMFSNGVSSLVNFFFVQDGGGDGGVPRAPSTQKTNVTPFDPSSA
jgi:hypothetical protein